MSKKKKKEEVIQPHLLKNIEKQKLRIKIIADTKADLKNNEKYKAYFAHFEPTSVDHFIERYASRKADFIIHGEMYKSMALQKASKFINEAKDYFKMIQQDKLLVFQYQWNEGNIKIEGIESNYDFYPLYDDVFNVDFISPVSKQDVDIMHDFIISHNDQGYNEFYHAPQLVSVRINLTEEKQGEPDYETVYLPHYYFFKRRRTGEKGISKDSLIQYRKEQKYMHIYHAEQARLREPQEQNLPDDPRPHLSFYNKEDVRKFISKFEEEKLLHFHDAYQREHDYEDDMDDKINMAVWHLQETDENHPLEPNDDWKQSILNAAQKSKKEKTARALYLVFDEYLQCRMNKTPFMPISQKEIENNEIWNSFKDNLLKGRELAGEPRDFNF